MDYLPSAAVDGGEVVEQSSGYAWQSLRER
jgi:hypothetical protein